MAVNAGGLSEGVFESELFGHVRGAFTDAKADRIGRFETYTIVLPVKGDYASLRRFCEKVLLKVPYRKFDVLVEDVGGLNAGVVEQADRRENPSNLGDSTSGNAATK